MSLLEQTGGPGFSKHNKLKAIYSNQGYTESAWELHLYDAHDISIGIYIMTSTAQGMYCSLCGWIALVVWTWFDYRDSYVIDFIIIIIISKLLLVLFCDQMIILNWQPLWFRWDYFPHQLISRAIKHC